MQDSLPRHLTALIFTALGAGLLMSCGESLPSSTTSVPIISTSPNGNQVAQPNAASINALTRVINADAPDPAIIVDANSYFLFTTDSGGLHVPVWTSPDMGNWQLIGDSVPTLPSWSSNNTGTTWAPSVIRVGPNDYRMVFSTQSSANVECLAVARATSVTGPYTNVGSAPLSCGNANSGALDGDFFKGADGNIYLVYRISGLAQTQPQIYVQQMSADATTLVGSATGVLSSTLTFEGNILLAPALCAGSAMTHIFYGTNDLPNSPSALAYASASATLGPYSKQSVPAIAANPNLVSPGGPTTFVGLDGNTYLAFHAWNSASRNYRTMLIVPVGLLSIDGNLQVDF